MTNVEYRTVPPDGRWGFVIVFAISVTNIATFLPLVSFGIVFGGFMKSIGDEAAGTGLAIGVYAAIQWGAGLVANIMLQKMSYRKVGVVGAVLNFVGLFAASFATNLFELLISFSVVQGLGYGLMLPAMYTAFNLYFDKRKAVVFCFANSVVILVSISFPAFASFLMRNFGFRGTNAIQAAIALNCLPVMLCLQPVKWHLKKRKMSLHQIIPHELSKLIQQKKELIENESKALDDEELEDNDDQDQVVDSSVWKSIVNSLDLGLFTDPIYVNIIIGISLCLAADSIFLSALPLLLKSSHIASEDSTLILTIFYTADIAGRLTLFAVTACTTVRNRYLFLLGASLAVCFRIAFVCGDSFWWLAVCTGCLGSLRCLFQATYPLIIAERYTKRFVTAFSLFMMICGIISLLVGFLIGAAKDASGSDDMVVHVLTVLNLLCAIPWSIEYFYLKIAKRDVTVS